MANVAIAVTSVGSMNHDLDGNDRPWPVVKT